MINFEYSKFNLSSLTRPRAFLLLLPFQIPVVPHPCGIPCCIFPTSVFSSSPYDIPCVCQVVVVKCQVILTMSVSSSSLVLARYLCSFAVFVSVNVASLVTFNQPYVAQLIVVCKKNDSICCGSTPPITRPHR